MLTKTRYIISLLVFFHLTLIAQAQPQWSMHTAIGVDEDVIPLRQHRSIQYPGWYFEMPYYSLPYIEVGPAFRQNQLGIVLSARILAGSTNPLLQRESEMKLTVSPNLYVQYYFGKQDKQAYRLSFHSSLVFYPITTVFYPDEPNPVPNPNFPKTQVYYLNGLEAATRIIRKGVFANTYLSFSYQLAPKSNLDRIIMAENIWSQRMSLGFTCSLLGKRNDENKGR